MTTNKYAPVHVDISAEGVFDALEGVLNPEILKTHSVRGLMLLTDQKYVIRLEWDVRKSMNMVGRR